MQKIILTQSLHSYERKIALTGVDKISAIAAAARKFITRDLTSCQRRKTFEPTDYSLL